MSEQRKRRAKLKFIAHDIRGCGRCGGNHRKVLARYFRRPPQGGWDSWAKCPRTGEPILLDTGGAPTTDRRPFLPAEKSS